MKRLNKILLCGSMMGFLGLSVLNGLFPRNNVRLISGSSICGKYAIDKDKDGKVDYTITQVITVRRPTLLIKNKPTEEDQIAYDRDEHEWYIKRRNW